MLLCPLWIYWFFFRLFEIFSAVVWFSRDIQLVHSSKGYVVSLLTLISIDSRMF